MANLSNWKDEDLVRVYEEHHLSSDAFYKTPKWKKWVLGVTAIALPIAGFSAIISALARAPSVVIAMAAVGAAGTLLLWAILRREGDYRRLREALREELVRRGLYEKSSVRIVAPWE